MLQGVLCECLLIKVINKIVNKIIKRVLLNESCIKFGANLMHVSGILGGGKIDVSGASTT